MNFLILLKKRWFLIGFLYFENSPWNFDSIKYMLFYISSLAISFILFFRLTNDIFVNILKLEVFYG